MSIVLTKLSKRFGNALVVNRFSLQINDGELFVLLGASGSGKSTVLRMIAGLIKPEEGTIELNGKNVTKLPPQKRDTGFVFQNYSLFRHMNVADNIEFGLDIRKAPAAERRRRREELLELVGLSGLGNRFSNQLSGGQQQRVALARALAYQPAVLLLDEPFGALDVKIRGQLRKTLKEIQQQLKVTTILVTHDQEEAFELADRIGVIERGNLIEVGTPKELYHRPRTEFAANFIGGKNVLIGRVEEGIIKLGNTALPMPSDLASHETRVRILFRPETVLLQKEPFPDNSGVFVLGKGKIFEKTFAGSFQRIRLEVDRPLGIRPYSQDFGDQNLEIDAIRPSENESSESFGVGDNLWVGFKQYHVLQTSWPKVLVCTDDSKSSQNVTDLGCLISKKARSQATLLYVTGSAEAVPAARERMEAIRQKWLKRVPGLETRVRQGSSKEEILIEAQEGKYELVVLGRKERPLKSIRGLGTIIRSLLQRVAVPILLVQDSRPDLANILICSAVGEPGKADVRVGGRLARLVGANATVLHAGSRQSEDEKMRTSRHLEHALSTLDTFGVKSDYKIGQEPAVEYILNEANSGKYGLVVIGAPAPDSGRLLYWHDFASEIVNGTTVPVLIVPMVE
jgi:sulfate/thiosulfate transport system ATP-binding protein